MARLPSDVDPARLNIEPKKRRRRKLRNKPDPKPTLKAGQAAAEKKLYKMPLPPGMLHEPAEDGGWILTSPHNDLGLWEVQLHAMFGTRSTSMVDFLCRELRRLSRQVWDGDGQGWKIHEIDMNAALAFVADIQPANIREAALAVQMWANHVLQLNLSRDAFNHGGMVMEKDAALASKLARTFTMQLEALRAMRGVKRPPIRQAITVKRETHYHQHSHLHDKRAPSGGGGVQENERQSHEPRAETIEGRATLLSDESGGEVVPLSSHARET